MAGKAEGRRLGLFFALAFLGVGCYQPFFAILMARHGYAGWAIGLLTAAGSLAALATGPLVGRWWDRTRHRRAVLGTLAAVAAGGSVLPGAFLHDGLGFELGGLAVMATATTAIIPIGTAATLALLGDADRFGRLRLVGSLTFALAALGGATLYQHIGFRWLFPAYGGLLAAAALTLPVPVGPPTPRRAHAPAGQDGVLTPPVRWFLVAVFLTQLANAGANSMLGLYYVKRLALAQTGFPWAFTALLEVPVFFWLPRWLQRYGPARLVLLAMTGYGMRLLILPWIAGLPGFLAVGALQAVAFTGFYGGQVALMERLTPADQRGVAQNVLAAWGMGFANLVGAAVGGVLYSNLHPTGMFVVLAATALIGAATFWRRVASAHPLGSGAAATWDGA